MPTLEDCFLQFSQLLTREVLGYFMQLFGWAVAFVLIFALVYFAVTLAFGD